MIESNFGGCALMDRGTVGSRRRVLLAGEIVDGVAVGAVGGAQWCGDGRGLASELAESGAQEPGVQAGEEQGVTESLSVTW